MAVQSLPEIREIVGNLAKKYGAQRVYLFGSYARGDMTADSDIDLRIDKVRFVVSRLPGCWAIWRMLLASASI